MDGKRTCSRIWTHLLGSVPRAKLEPWGGLSPELKTWAILSYSALWGLFRPRRGDIIELIGLAGVIGPVPGKQCSSWERTRPQ